MNENGLQIQQKLLQHCRYVFEPRLSIRRACSMILPGNFILFGLIDGNILQTYLISLKYKS
eukprot:snap_masked-scaffold_7-processed-gene-2.55-mRNA-1 protein AED:1.00 eAED:1.00 QI:0/0/0/0/1/1/2/0/60